MIPDFLSRNPEVLAVLIAIAGFLVANALAALTERLLIRLDTYLRHRGPGRLEHLDLLMLRQALRGLAYYGSLVFFLLLALQTLSITVVREWLDLLLQFIPQLILAALIILSGYFISIVARSLFAGLIKVTPDHLAPRLLQTLVIITATLTGLAQTSIDISFISNVLVLLLAFFVGGLSLAFALGSRQLVENLLARRSLDRYRIGDMIRINGIEGRIEEILSTAVVLKSGEGIVTIPASRFIDSEVTQVIEADSGNSNEPPE